MARFATIFAVLWLGALLAGTMACGERVAPEGGRYQVHVANVTDRSAGDEDISRAAILLALGRAFANVSSFELAEDEVGLAAELWFAEQPGPDGRVRDLIVGLRVETPDDLRASLGRDGLEANVLLERESGDASLVSDLNLAVGRAVGVLEARVGLARGDAKQVEALLASDDPELILLALEWVRDRRSGADAASVAALLSHDEERVGLLAIEALGAVGGPEHVMDLLRGIRLADAGQAHRTYEALASLGGPDARAFLEFAARNEEEDERRQAASRALAILVDQADAPHALQSRAADSPKRGHRQ